MSKYKNILCIKMIGDQTYDIFVIQDGSIVGLQQHESNRRESMEVLDVIDLLLDDISLTLEDISLIAVMHGRGSFTSNRLGAITANTFGFTLQVPIIGIQVESQDDSSPESFCDKVHEYLKTNTPQVNEYVTPTYSAP